MNNILIEKTGNSPAIQADWAAGLLAMQGDSYPENSFEFFQPLIDWVEAYLHHLPTHSLQLELELVYLNTSSIRALMDILDLLETAWTRTQAKVGVRWRYDSGNERVGDLAREFSEDWSFPFEVIPK